MARSHPSHLTNRSNQSLAVAMTMEQSREFATLASPAAAKLHLVRPSNRFTMSTKFIFASIFMLAQCLVVQQPLGAQVTSPDQRPEFDHLTLHVQDLEKSAEFYRNIIGLEQVPDPFKDGKHRFFRLSAHTQLHLVPGAKAGMQHDEEGHFALRVASVASFCTMLQHKKIKYFGANDQEGVVTTRPDGVKQIYFRDPDGYRVEVNDSRL